MILELAAIVDSDSANCNLLDDSDSSQIPRLSVQNEIDLAKCFQLVVGFGLLPNILPNIGIPIQKRSKWHNLFSSTTDITDEQVSIDIIFSIITILIHNVSSQKYSRLTVTVRALCEIEKGTSFGPKLAAKHLSDMLAALLQICHAPISKPTSDSQVLLWQRLHEERQEFIVLLDSILKRTYPPLLVQSLLLLQGPSPSHAKIIRVGQISIKINLVSMLKLLACLGRPTTSPEVADSSLCAFVDSAIDET